MHRVMLSAIVLIITNLIVGSISLSLGLVVAIVLAGVGLVAVVLLALLGLCVILERVGWLAPGWTDKKIDNLKQWAVRKWRDMPQWYRSEKQRIIEMVIQILRGKGKEAENPATTWRSVTIGLVLLLAIVLVKHTMHLTIGWSLVVVAIASLAISVPILYFRSPVDAGKNSKVETSGTVSTDPMALHIEATPEEIQAALKALVELGRAGRLEAILDWGSERAPIPDPPAAKSKPQVPEG
jgi:hypothetical protein